MHRCRPISPPQAQRAKTGLNGGSDKVYPLFMMRRFASSRGILAMAGKDRQAASRGGAGRSPARRRAYTRFPVLRPPHVRASAP